MLEHAQRYLSRGWRPIPVPFRQKGPVLDAWQRLRISEAELPQYFAGRCNVGVLTGEPSGGLVDVDLDHPLAVQLAPEFLPPTSCVFGRAGKPRSHHLYVSPGAVTHQRTTGKAAGMIVELRASGVQTVFPGSVHESGEPIEWAEEGEPATVDHESLRQKVDALANEVERRLGLRSGDGLPEDAELPDATGWSTHDKQNDGLKPGADFNARGDVREVLRRNGWTLVREQSSGVERWRRPGKSQGISGSLKDGKAFYCFTSSTAIPDSLETKRGYSPFAVLTYLEYGGDFSASAKALATQGYGEQAKPKSSGSTPVRKPTLPEPFQPFPVEALPEPLRSFVDAGAKTIGCDTSFIALPLLSVVAAAIGNTRRLRSKRGWTVPPILWTAIVGESGTAKTPAFKLAVKAMRERQRRAIQRQEEDEKRYEVDLAQWEKAYTEWKRDKKTIEEPPKKPEPPQADRCMVSDTTVEALAPILKANPRGLLLARDELNGWLGSFDRYAGGKGGADASHWLSMYNGETIIVDRRTGQPRTIFVPLASMCVAGGIQPGILDRALGREHRESGLCARLLLSCPPRKPKRWTEEDIDPAVEDRIVRLLDWLYELEPALDDGEQLQPVVIGMTKDARAAWTAFYNAHAEEMADLSGELAAAYNKLEETACRLALVVHYSRWAGGDETVTKDSALDRQSMDAGITLCKWFKREITRVYSILRESDESREQRGLVEWIERKGGCVTARDLARGPRPYRALPEAAEDALNELVAAGIGDWEFLPTSAEGGRPTRLFRLKPVRPGDETPSETEDFGGFGSVASGEEVINEPRDDEEGDVEWTF